MQWSPSGPLAVSSWVLNVTETATVSFSGISVMSGITLVFIFTATFLCVLVSRSQTAGANTLGHDGHIVYINTTYGDDTRLSLWW